MKKLYKKYPKEYWKNDFSKKVKLPPGGHIVKEVKAPRKTIRDRPTEVVCPVCSKNDQDCYVKHLVYILRLRRWLRRCGTYDVGLVCVKSAYKFK